MNFSAKEMRKEYEILGEVGKEKYQNFNKINTNKT